MKTVVKAIDQFTVIDGWGFKIRFLTPQNITADRHYLLQNKKIVKELKTQEELIVNMPSDYIEFNDDNCHEKYL